MCALTSMPNCCTVSIQVFGEFASCEKRPVDFDLGVGWTPRSSLCVLPFVLCYPRSYLYKVRVVRFRVLRSAAGTHQWGVCPRAMYVWGDRGELWRRSVLVCAATRGCPPRVATGTGVGPYTPIMRALASIPRPRHTRALIARCMCGGPT